LSSSSSFIVYFSFRPFAAGSPHKLSSSLVIVDFSFLLFDAGSLRQSCPAHNRSSFIIRIVFSSLDRHESYPAHHRTPSTFRFICSLLDRFGKVAQLIIVPRILFVSSFRRWIATQSYPAHSSIVYFFIASFSARSLRQSGSSS
jgi:hypothetical protein